VAQVKATVSNVHDSHGLVFDLNLEKSGRNDEAIHFLQKNLKPLISGEYRNRSTLYVNRIIITETGVKLTFVEQNKDLTKDNKHVILIIEVDPYDVPGGT